MLDFYYHTPTEIFFGKGKEKQVGEIIKNYGYRKIMIQYGKGSVKKSGLYDVVVSSLKQNGIEFVEMGGVEPNPKLSFVRQAIKVAKEQGVEKVITKVDRPSISKMVKKLGLDTAVSPRNVIANHIVRFVRANQTANASGITTLYKLHDKVEAVEFLVGDDFDKTDVALKELSIKRGVLVGGIVRDTEFILPTGNTKLNRGDRVIIVTSVKHITELNQIFK